ncbi:MAG: universal stress protein [Dehalococcoidia bacterium]|nr:universal stress protein [Dehalococcoidia bacterium]
MRILVTTDGSERSLLAVPHAARLARATGSELTLGRILDPLIDLHREIATRIDIAATNVRTRWLGELATHLADVHVGGEVAVGRKRARESMTDAVLELVFDTRADLLVMSSRGAGMLRHALLGSTALGVVQTAEVPVLVVGEQAHPPLGDPGPYRLLATTDGSPASHAVLAAVGPLFPPSTAEITLLQVCEPAPGHRDSQEEACRAKLEAARAHLPPDLDIATVLREASPTLDVPANILAEAEARSVDAIAMSTHGASARRRLFAGSIAMSVLTRSTRPVLLVRSRF